MYELKCPSCGQVLRAAFVRSGAVTDCPHCAHRYRIKDACISRRVPTAEGEGPDGRPSLLPGAKELASMAGARLRVDEEGNVIGLSGLSEMMRHEGVGAARPRRTASPAREDAPSPPPGRATRPASPSARRRRSSPRSLYVLASTLCVGLAVVGVALWHASTVSPGGAPAEVSDLPVIMGMRLAHDPWQQPDAPFDPSAWRDAEDQGVHLRNTSLGFPAPDRPMLSATVTSSRTDLVERAYVYLALVDQSDTELARTRVSVALVAPGRPYALRLPVPAELAGQWLSIASRVEVARTMPEAHLLREARAVPMWNGNLRGVQVTVTNDHDEPLRRTVFLITARDEAGDVLQRWRATWSRTLEPGEEFECHVVLPTLGERPVPQWDVQAAGTPDVPREADEADEPADPVEADEADDAEDADDVEESDAAGDASDAPPTDAAADDIEDEPAEPAPVPDP